MILLSNNLHGKMPLPKDAVIRINSAWVTSVEELEEIVKLNEKSEIFLDFPSGRTKPPKPVITLMELIMVATKYENIRYFAVSNAEDKEFLAHIRRMLPDYTELVPKIETISGVRKIEQIIEASKCRKVMLDKEDLYLNCGTDAELYEDNMEALKVLCRDNNVHVLQLCGVVFE